MTINTVFSICGDDAVTLIMQLTKLIEERGKKSESESESESENDGDGESESKNMGTNVDISK